MLLRGVVKGLEGFSANNLALARANSQGRTKERQAMLEELRAAELHPLQKRLLESQIAKNLGVGAGGSRSSASGKGGPTAGMVNDQLPGFAKEAYGAIENSWNVPWYKGYESYGRGKMFQWGEDPEIPWADKPNAEGKRIRPEVDDLATQWHRAGKKAQQQIGLMTGDPNEARQYLYSYYRNMLEAGGDGWKRRIMEQFPGEKWEDVEQRVFDGFWRGAYGFDAYGSERADPTLPLAVGQRAAAAAGGGSGGSVPIPKGRGAANPNVRHGEADAALDEGTAPPEESWQDWRARRAGEDEWSLPGMGSQLDERARDWASQPNPESQGLESRQRGGRWGEFTEAPPGSQLGGGGKYGMDGEFGPAAAAPSLQDALFAESEGTGLESRQRGGRWGEFPPGDPRGVVIEEQSGDSDAPKDNLVDGTPPLMTDPPEKLEQSYITSPSGTPIPVDTPPPRSVRPSREPGWGERAGGWIEDRIEDIAGLLPDGEPERPMPGSRSITRVTPGGQRATPRDGAPRRLPSAVPGGDSTATPEGIDWTAKPRINTELPPYIRDQYDDSWLESPSRSAETSPRATMEWEKERTGEGSMIKTPDGQWIKLPPNQPSDNGRGSEQWNWDKPSGQPEPSVTEPTRPDTSSGKRRELEPPVSPAQSGIVGEGRTRLKEQLKQREGFRMRQYDDRGQKAIGHGFKVEMLKRLGYTEDQLQNMTRAEADKVMDRLIDEVFYPEVKSVLPEFDSFSSDRQLGIMDMLYNLGLTEFREFDQTLGFIKAGEWHKAADELLDSDAARLLPKRYRAIARKVGGPGYKPPRRQRTATTPSWSDEARM